MDLQEVVDLIIPQPIQIWCRILTHFFLDPRKRYDAHIFFLGKGCYYNKLEIPGFR